MLEWEELQENYKYPFIIETLKGRISYFLVSFSMLLHKFYSHAILLI